MFNPFLGKIFTQFDGCIFFSAGLVKNHQPALQNPWKLTWNLKITQLKRKIIWTKPPLLCSMLIFQIVRIPVIQAWWPSPENTKELTQQTLDPYRRWRWSAVLLLVSLGGFLWEDEENLQRFWVSWWKLCPVEGDVFSYGPLFFYMIYIRNIFCNIYYYIIFLILKNIIYIWYMIYDIYIYLYIVDRNKPLQYIDEQMHW